MSEIDVRPAVRNVVLSGQVISVGTTESKLEDGFNVLSPYADSGATIQKDYSNNAPNGYTVVGLANFACSLTGGEIVMVGDTGGVVTIMNVGTSNAVTNTYSPYTLPSGKQYRYYYTIGVTLICIRNDLLS